MYSFYQVNPSQEAYCKLTQVHCPLAFCVWVFQLAIFDNYMYMYWNIMTRDCIQINMGITKSSSFHMQKKLSVYPQAHISFSLWSVCFGGFFGGWGYKEERLIQKGRIKQTRWNEGSRHPDQWLYSGIMSASVTNKVWGPCIAHMYYIWLVS